jgi:hypothetical protein
MSNEAKLKRELLLLAALNAPGDLVPMDEMQLPMAAFVGHIAANQSRLSVTQALLMAVALARYVEHLAEHKA